MSNFQNARCRRYASRADSAGSALGRRSPFNPSGSCRATDLDLFRISPPAGGQRPLRSAPGQGRPTRGATRRDSRPRSPRPATDRRRRHGRRPGPRSPAGTTGPIGSDRPRLRGDPATTPRRRANGHRSPPRKPRPRRPGCPRPGRGRPARRPQDVAGHQQAQGMKIPGGGRRHRHRPSHERPDPGLGTEPPDHVAGDLRDVMLVRRRDPPRLPLRAGVGQGRCDQVRIERHDPPGSLVILAGNCDRPRGVEPQERLVILEIRLGLDHAGTPRTPVTMWDDRFILIRADRLDKSPGPFVRSGVPRDFGDRSRRSTIVGMALVRFGEARPLIASPPGREIPPIAARIESASLRLPVGEPSPASLSDNSNAKEFAEPGFEMWIRKPWGSLPRSPKSPRPPNGPSPGSRPSEVPARLGDRPQPSAAGVRNEANRPCGRRPERSQTP